MTFEDLNKILTPDTLPVEIEHTSPIGSLEEQSLLMGEINRFGRLLGGATGHARYVEIKDGGAGVFKPYDEITRPKEYYHSRERAAYLIDQFLGFNFVPPTVIRVINGEQGSLQRFVSDTKMAFEVKIEDISSDERAKLALFDLMVDNYDRSAKNYLIKNDKIIAIDHGFIFYGDGTKAYPIELECLERLAISSEVLQGLEKFTEWKDGQELLKNLLLELFDSTLVSTYMRRIIAAIQSIDNEGRFQKDVFISLLNA